MLARPLLLVSLLSLISVGSYAKSSVGEFDSHSPETVATAFFNTIMNKGDTAEMAKLMFLSADTLKRVGSRKVAEDVLTKCFEVHQKRYIEGEREVKLLDVSIDDRPKGSITASVIIRTQEEGRKPELMEITLQQTYDGIWKIDGFNVSDNIEDYISVEDFISLCQEKIQNDIKK